jgi:coenzyme PQQ precursor peptide PqqA
LTRVVGAILDASGDQPRSQKMTWETPEFVEVKMDAEINSYQDDFGGDRDTGV